MCLGEAPLLVAQGATLLAAGVPGWEAALSVPAAYPQRGTALAAATVVVPAGSQVLVVPCHGRAAAQAWWLEDHLVLELAMVAAVAAPAAVAAAVLLQAVH